MEHGIKNILTVIKKETERTFHGGEGVLDLELTSLAVHPDLELHSLQLLPLLRLLVAMSSTPSQQAQQVLQGASHGNSQKLTHTWKAHTSTSQKLSRTTECREAKLAIYTLSCSKPATKPGGQ